MECINYIPGVHNLSLLVVGQAIALDCQVGQGVLEGVQDDTKWWSWQDEVVAEVAVIVTDYEQNVLVVGVVGAADTTVAVGGSSQVAREDLIGVAEKMSGL
jgi:hypothetical protein